MPNKLTSTDILEGICEEIRVALARNDVFSNTSLCYSGAHFVFDISVSLQSRGPQELEATVEKRVGEPPEPDTQEVATVHEQGERIAGKGPGRPKGVGNKKKFQGSILR